MSAAHRSLARLPLEIFENLVHNNATLTSEEEEDDEEEYNYFTSNGGNATDPRQPLHVDAAMLREAICQKLKAIPPSKQMPHRRKSLRLAAAAAASAAAASAAASGNIGNTSSATINNATLLDSIQTVGPLLFMSKPALLRSLDPLLTYEECSELIRRICLYCSPTPKSAMALLHMTRELDNAPNFMQQQQHHHHDEVEKTSTTTSMVQQPCLRHIPTGLTSLDHQLRGGVRVGTLTEIVGLTATAKSQLAMQLCIMAGIHLKDSNRQGAVYIDSEKKMSLQRLEEMAMNASRHYVKQQQQQRQLVALQTTLSLSPRPLMMLRHPNGNHNHYHQAAEAEEESFRYCRDFLANVSVHTPTTMDELVATLAFVEDDIYLRNERGAQEESLGRQQQKQYASSTRRRVGNAPPGTAATMAVVTATATFPVRLLILDSIAAPARREFGSGSAPQRAAAVMQCAQTLKRLADELQLAVVVLNQVDHASTSSSSSSLQYQQQQQQHRAALGTAWHHHLHRAALGTAWHHCVSTRIQLSSLPPLQPTGNDIGGGNSNCNMIASSSSSQQEQITRIPRMAGVVKSNVTGQGQAVSFEVTTRGLVEMLPSTTSSQHNYM